MGLGTAVDTLYTIIKGVWYIAVIMLRAVVTVTHGFMRVTQEGLGRVSNGAVCMLRK